MILDLILEIIDGIFSIFQGILDGIVLRDMLYDGIWQSFLHSWLRCDPAPDLVEEVPLGILHGIKPGRQLG